MAEREHLSLWETVGELRPALRWVRAAVPVLVLVGGIATAPIVLPILPPEKIAP